MKILSCSSCGASLSPNAMKCEFCDNVNVISKETSPFKLNSILSKQYLNSTELSKDTFNSALLHLNLKNYTIATKLLEKEIEKNPINADAYYYSSLCLTNGKRIKSLPFSVIKKISSYLNTAIELDENSKFYFLAAIVNYDFFQENGMILPEPNYNLLLKKTKEFNLENEDFEYLKNIIEIPKNETFNQIITNQIL
jgi:tetratricopeptide (TPR) repeat protein